MTDEYEQDIDLEEAAEQAANMIFAAPQAAVRLISAMRQAITEERAERSAKDDPSFLGEVDEWLQKNTKRQEDFQSLGEPGR